MILVNEFVFVAVKFSNEWLMTRIPVFLRLARWYNERLKLELKLKLNRIRKFIKLRIFPICVFRVLSFVNNLTKSVPNVR